MDGRNRALAFPRSESFSKPQHQQLPTRGMGQEANLKRPENAKSLHHQADPNLLSPERDLEANACRRNTRGFAFPRLWGNDGLSPDLVHSTWVPFEGIDCVWLGF